MGYGPTYYEPTQVTLPLHSCLICRLNRFGNSLTSNCTSSCINSLHTSMQASNHPSIHPSTYIYIYKLKKITVDLLKINSTPVAFRFLKQKVKINVCHDYHRVLLMQETVCTSMSVASPYGNNIISTDYCRSPKTDS